MKKPICAFAVALSLSVFSMSAHATTVDDYTGYVQVSSTSTGLVTGTNYASAPGAVAFYSPIPFFAIETQAAGNGYVNGGPTSSAFATFTYYFAVDGGIYNTPVNVFVHTDLLTQISGDAYAYATIDVASSGATVCTDGTCGSGNGTYFSGAIPLTVLAGNEYSVHFELEALATYGFAGTAFASADPYIYVDSNDPNANQYSIVVSRGVSNVAATPLPAALPMFVSGLGALGLLSWRRNRKKKA